MTLYGVAYLRVSTEKQDLENQRNYIEKWASEHGIQILQYYYDYAVSGATALLDRPGFMMLVSDVVNNKLSPRPQVLVVYEISRLVRNFNQLYRLLDIVENKLGLLILSTSPKESFMNELQNPFRSFLLSIFEFVAHMEREFIRQRTKAALERKLQNRVPKWKELLHSHGVEIARLYESNVSMRDIARKYGVSLTVIRKVLHEMGYLQLPGDRCPRCLHSLVVADRAIDMTNKTIKVTLRCPNCGFEIIKHIEVTKP